MILRIIWNSLSGLSDNRRSLDSFTFASMPHSRLVPLSKGGSHL
jgi:hypothetical protein